MYATLFLGILDPVTRELRYVNAGHNPQFVLRRQGGLEKMSSTGLPVGLLAGRGYNEVTMPLEAGDLVFFYTDGCVETENETGEMFGADRLEPLLVSVHATGADNVLQHVERALEEFRGARELYDDATMMAVRIG
jgi:sigma-B regulation protein RsbU (phosphoserine phosphatase)